MSETSTTPRPPRPGEVEVAPVRPGEDLDWPRLEGYLRARVPELSGDFDVLTYLVRFGARSKCFDRASTARNSRRMSWAPGASCPNAAGLPLL